jgi:hypothetical protein
MAKNPSLLTKLYCRIPLLFTGLDFWEKASLGFIYSRLSLPYTSLDCKRGCGQEKNPLTAYRWFGIASEIGSPHEMKVAQDSLKKIVPEMTPEEIKKGDALIDAWKPAPARCDTRGYFIVAP